MPVIRPPFTWFGGKALAADLIWSRLGSDCGNYVEPFFGSGAVWLNRPKAFDGWAVVNDLDGNVSNFWRATLAAPEQVAEAACYPVNECDLHSRHLWLVNNLGKLAGRLMADPEYYEARTAGWWAWGACSWIAGGWCAGDGAWHSELDADGVATFVNGYSGQGVNKQLPHLGNGGRGVNKQLPNSDRLEWLQSWFADLAESMRDVRIACGDWERICSGGTMTRNGTCAVLLDPPYSQTEAVYAHDSKTVSGDVRRWCQANGDNPLLRVALCGHDGEHNELEAQGWTVETWAKAGGYQGADDRERIWFSQHCLKPETQGMLF